ncbi:MAG: DUF2183 domain-containing protein [Halobacteriovoraceae bacterium]|jgi:hypothetical protein|nr:DUF2183 domain-containing protein [Halobacteriovoraceae bacterium]
MERILIIALLLFAKISFAYDISVVSDLDDTLKITNVQSMAEAARNALFSKKAFQGMPRLLEKMESYSNDLYILTASPKFLNKPIKKFLSYNDILIKDIFMRSLTREADKKKYKYKSLQKILELTLGDKLILIGDNTQVDESVYLQIKSEYPDRVEAIYVRKIKDKPSAKGVFPFYTAYGIALAEYKSGRLSLVQVLDIGKSILLTKDLKQYIPKFAYCPKRKSEFPRVTVSTLALMTKQVRKKITSFCLDRLPSH